MQRQLAADPAELGILIPESCLKWAKAQRPDSDYLTGLLHDFKTIEPHLPIEVSSILDIGCGIAGIDVLLKRKYPRARLELLDGDGDKTVYGWHENKNLIYNDRKATEDLLRANGFSVDRWHDVGTKEHLKADLVISLISWGFHYPLSTYKVSGYVIADIRRGRESVDGKVIHRTQKYDRCVVRM